MSGRPRPRISSVTTFGLIALALVACDRGGGADAGSGSTLDAASAEALPIIDEEPNDSPAEARSLGAGGRGQIATGRDVDYYKLEGLPTLFQLKAETDFPGSLRLDIVGRAGDPPETLEPGGGFYAVRALADRYLVVRAVGISRLEYTLQVLPLELPDLGVLLAEPNDADHPAHVDAFPARAAGFYDRPGDVDVVDVAVRRLPRRGGITIEVSPLGGAQPSLTVRSPDGAVLVNLVAERAGEGVGIPNLGRPSEIDDLLVEIHEARGQVVDRPYTLSIHRPTLDPEWGDGPIELEPNDSDEQAQPLPDGGVLGGFLHKTDDLDVFALSSSGERSLSARVSPDSGTDLEVTVVDGARRFRFDDAGPGEPETLCGLGVGPSLWLEVRAPRGADRNARYRLEASLEGGAFEREPNDDPEQPGGLLSLQPGGEVRGYVYPAGDVDVFGLQTGMGPLDEPLPIHFEVEPPPGVDVSVELIDEEGLAAMPPRDSGGSGAAERVDVDLSWNRSYHLIVRGERGARCDAPYRLIVR